jgi:hypothetical protein
MERNQVAEAYRRWAPVYDVVFGPVFRKGRRTAVVAAERIGGRILEVGVGTGLSLTEYASGNRVIELAVMDAENLSYPDASYAAMANGLTFPARRRHRRARRWGGSSTAPPSLYSHRRDLSRIRWVDQRIAL